MPKLGLSDLLDQDLSSDEYFQTLDGDIQQEIRRQDVVSFEEMKEIAEKMKRRAKGGRK